MSHNIGYMVYMRRSMIYLTKLADDNLTPVQWNNKRKLALIIPSLKQAYAVAQKASGKSRDCLLMSVDSLGIVRKCKVPADFILKKFSTRMVFSSGGSVTTEMKARSTDHAISKAFRDMKTLNRAKDNKIVSIELIPKRMNSGV